MRLQLIRNATLKLTAAGRTILIDPYFAPPLSLPSYTGRSPNPLVGLPAGIDDILASVDLVLVSHLHTDHFDSVAKTAIPKSLPLICQPDDEETIRETGFTDIRPLDDELTFEGLTFRRRAGSHGIGPVVEKMGNVMSFHLQARGEPSLYWCGDTVLYPPVLETIRALKPDIIVTHSCGALWDGDLIVMDAAQTIELCRAAPRATVVAVHMEALDHATVDRAALRQAADAAGIARERLLIPFDGETIDLGDAA